VVRSNLDDHFMKSKNKLPEKLTPLMRSRVDATYNLIRQIETSEDEHVDAQASALLFPPMRRVSRFRKTIMVTAVAATMGVIVFGAGFLSKTIASSLKSIPVIGSIFKLMGDAGLRRADEEGLVSVVNEKFEQDGISIIIPKVTYDGIRIAFEVTRQAPPGTKGVLLDLRAVFEKRVPKGGFDRIRVTFPGSYGGLTFGTPTNEPSESVIVDISEVSGGMPDHFDMNVKIWLKGYDEPYELTVPVTKITKDNIVLMPDKSTKSYENFHYTIEKIEMTPITIKMKTRLTGSSSTGNLGDIGEDIFDDKGRQLEGLGGSGSIGDTSSIWTSTSTYESVSANSTFITVKPYISKQLENNKFKNEYIPELEFKIPIPASKK